MRRRLVLSAAAITLTIVLSFAIPLGLLIRQVARDRAMTAAERSAQTLVPVLASVNDPASVDQVVEGVNTASTGGVSVIEADGHVLGAPAPIDSTVTLARRGKAFATDVPGGRRLLVPVVAPNGGIDVVSVMVRSAELDHGVGPAWLLLGGLSLLLLAVAVVAADRLAATVLHPVRDLAATAERLGQGDLEARVEPSGPPEIVEVGETLNRLAERITELLAAERELVADLSHRLRTPITALRLDAERLTDPDERRRLNEDIDEIVRSLDAIIDEARRAPEGRDSQCDLVEVTRRRLDFWAVLLEEQDRDLEVRVPRRTTRACRRPTSRRPSTRSSGTCSPTPPTAPGCASPSTGRTADPGDSSSRTTGPASPTSPSSSGGRAVAAARGSASTSPGAPPSAAAAA